MYVLSVVCMYTTSDGTILCDTSTGTLRPYVPEQFYCSVFDSLNSLSHPSIQATQHLRSYHSLCPAWCYYVHMYVHNYMILLIQ